MINKKIIETEIKILRKTKIWSSVLHIYFQEIIEAVVSTHAKDLNREDAIQECWVFLMKIIPKIKLKSNIGAYVYTCLRHYVSDQREVKEKHTYVSLEDCPPINTDRVCIPFKDGSICKRQWEEENDY